MTLKTINDIFEIELLDYDSNGPIKVVKISDLKKEAIKDIEHWKDNISIMFGANNHEGVRCCEEIIKYIKWKNNITEKDSK